MKFQEWMNGNSSLFKQLCIKALGRVVLPKPDPALMEPDRLGVDNTQSGAVDY